MKYSSTDMILSNLIHDPEFATIVLPNLKNQYMAQEPSYEYVLKRIQEHYESHGRVLSVDAIRIGLSTDLKVLQNDELESDIHALLDKLNTHVCKEDPLGFRIEKAQEHCQWIAAEDAAEFCSDIIDSINQNEGKYTHEDLVKTMQDVCDINFNPDCGELLDEGLEDFWEWLHDEDVYIPTNIKIIDEALSGGLYKGELTVIAGPQNSGKTLVTCDLTARFMKQSRNVLYISKENIKNKIKQRVYSNILRMDQHTMKSIKDNPKDRFINRAKESLKSLGKLVVKYDNSDDFTSADVKNIIITNEKKLGIKFDVVVIDNLYNLSSIKGYVNRLDTHQKLPKICEEVRNIAQECNVHIISPHQIALSKNKGEHHLYPDESDLALAKSISWVIDNLIMIGVDNNYRKKGWLVFNIAKERSTGSKGLNFVIGVDTKYQSIYELEKQPEEGHKDDSKEIPDKPPTRNRSRHDDPKTGSRSNVRKVSRKKMQSV